MKSAIQMPTPDILANEVIKCAVVVAKHQLTGTVTTAVTETAFFVAPQPMTVTSVYLVPDQAYTPASGSNTQTMEVTSYTTAGVSRGTVAIGTIANATPSAVMVKSSLTLGSTYTLAAGQALTFKTTLAGTCTLPSGVIEVEGTID